MKIPKKLTNYYYWLQTIMMVLAVLLTYSISIWLTLMFITAISGFIDNNYDIDESLKENDMIRLIGNNDFHDYYFVRYTDASQKEAIITLFPGGDSSFEKTVDACQIYKEV
jgi:hypothetical protein